MSLRDSLTKEKPWAWLRMSRREYDKARLWKKCGMPREEFEEKILSLPQDVIELITENMHAEMLVDAIFKVKK